MMRRWTASLLALFVLGAGMQPVAAVASSCTDYLILGARGSGQASELVTEGMGPEVHQFAARMELQLLAGGSTVDLQGVDYPAVNPTDGSEKLPDRSKKSPRKTSYDASASAGADEILSEIDAIPFACEGETSLILAGYSQGADAIGRAVERLDDSPSDEQKLAWIAGIAAFGDPAFNPKDTGSAFGSYDASRSGFWGPRAKWSEYLTAPVVHLPTG